MTRSAVVSAEMVRIVELKEQFRELRESVERSNKEVKGKFKSLEDSVNKSSKESEALREDMKAFMKIILKDKGKEKEGKSSREEENSRDVSTARVGESKGILPTPAVSLKDQGNSKDPLNTDTLPKIELLTFEGKEPRVWLRKCTKYFDVYKVPKDQRIGIACLFLVDKADAWFHD